MNEIKNSITKIINERLISPFFGNFIISWIIWNWKIIYLTFFISEKQIEADKISYIVSNFYSSNNLLIYPLISTVILISIFPIITNGAYWVSLIFRQWRITIRNKIQEKDLLTIEQSINLREQIQNQEKKFEKLLENKNLKIKQLETQLNKQIDIEKTSHTESYPYDDPQIIANKILSSNEFIKGYKNISYAIQRKYRLVDLSNAESPSTKSVNFFISNNIITINVDGYIHFTTYGKKVAKELGL